MQPRAPDENGRRSSAHAGIANEWQQFRHAHQKNAALYSFEPYDLFRHELRKVIEPGAEWQPSGVPIQESNNLWHADTKIGGIAAARALDIARAITLGAEESSAPISNALFPSALHSLYISVYLDGRLRGCAGSAITEADRDIRILVEAALRDRRFADRAPNDRPERVAVTISLLFNQLTLGEMSAEEVAPRFRLGSQALAVQQNDRYGMLLPFRRGDE